MWQNHWNDCRPKSELGLSWPAHAGSRTCEIWRTHCCCSEWVVRFGGLASPLYERYSPMNQKLNNDNNRLRLYNPDGLPVVRGLRTSHQSPSSNGLEPWYKDLSSPPPDHHDFSQATLAFLRTFVKALNESELLIPSARGVYLPSGDAALALPMHSEERVYVAALLVELQGLSRKKCSQYAQALGGRLSTASENRSVVQALLDHAPYEEGSLGRYNSLLLNVYQKTSVLDDRGGVYLSGNTVKRDRNLQRSTRADSYGLIVFDL
jgi:hypothetical protein